jgi:hypothetical protein
VNSDEIVVISDELPEIVGIETLTTKSLDKSKLVLFQYVIYRQNLVADYERKIDFKSWGIL